ncbi:hypothetical protein VTH06DRAFT_644 [Thermothelomyces fergusii]
MSRRERGKGRGHQAPRTAPDYILCPLCDPEPSQARAIRPAPSTVHPDTIRRETHQETAAVDFLRRVLGRRPSNAKHNPLSSPIVRPQRPPLSGPERKPALHSASPPMTRWNQGTILVRADSVPSSPGPGVDAMAAPGDEDLSRRRAASLAARYPGDMSHRPLAILTREYRAADRAPHLHNPTRQQPHDTIDALDITGPVPGVYHHGGPFDPAMKARNRNKKYAPVEAVRSSNLEALKATPAEFVRDALIKHVPLQGTAVIPPGMEDFSGRTMEYEEGADLMREEDAEGGAYKRWDHILYRDDDLKGKGEPSFSHDQACHRRRRRRPRGDKAPGASWPGSGGRAHDYEMHHAPGLLPRPTTPASRARARTAPTSGCRRTWPSSTAATTTATTTATAAAGPAWAGATPRAGGSRGA